MNNNQAIELDNVLNKLRDLKQKLLTSDFFSNIKTFDLMFNNLKNEFNAIKNNPQSGHQTKITEIEKELAELNKFQQGKYVDLTNQYNSTKSQFINIFYSLKNQNSIDSKSYTKATQLYNALSQLRSKILDLSDGDSHNTLQDKLKKEQTFTIQSLKDGKPVYSKETVSFEDMYKTIKAKQKQKPDITIGHQRGQR